MPNPLQDILIKRELEGYDPSAIDAQAKGHPLPPNPLRSGFEGGMDFLKGLVWPSMSNDAPMMERLGGLGGAVLPWVPKGIKAADLLVDEARTPAEILHNHLMNFKPEPVTPIPTKVTGNYIPARRVLKAPEGFEFGKGRYKKSGKYTGAIGADEMDLGRDPALVAKRDSQQDFLKRVEQTYKSQEVVPQRVRSMDDLALIRPTDAPPRKMTIQEARAAAGERASGRAGTTPLKTDDQVMHLMSLFQSWPGTENSFAQSHGMSFSAFADMKRRAAKLAGR